MKVYIYTGCNHDKINNLPQPENIGWVSDYPEGKMSESELVKYVFYIVENISPMYNLLFNTTSMILFNAIRVAIKEKYINADDVYVTFVDEDGSIVQMRIDSDGRIDNQPENMFNTNRDLLRRLL